MRIHRSALVVALAGVCALGVAGGSASRDAVARPFSGRPTGAHPAAWRPAGGTALTALMTPRAATASDPLFLHVDGIPGDSAEAHHPGWIDVSGYQMTLAGAPGQSSSGRSQLGPFVVTVPLSRATLPLMSAVTTGQPLGTVVLQAATTSGGTELNYLTITLSGTKATAIQEASGGDRPDDSVTFTATSIAVTYIAADGTSASFCFNFRTSKTC